MEACSSRSPMVFGPIDNIFRYDSTGACHDAYDFSLFQVA